MIKKLIKIYAPDSIVKILTSVYILFKRRKVPRYKKPFRRTEALNCVTAYNKYGGYCIPRNSMLRPAPQVILRGEVWEEKTINFIEENYIGGDIIHAGTYFGDFLPALSKICHLKSKVWAFEPVREHYDSAQITLLLNKLQNVELSNLGLDDGNSRYDMILKDNKGQYLGGGSTVNALSRNKTSGSIEEIQTIALDEYIPKDRSISIIHLDIEGFEQRALDGAMSLIKRSFPDIVLESLPKQKWLDKKLIPLGYRVVGEVEGNTILKCSR